MRLDVFKNTPFLHRPRRRSRPPARWPSGLRRAIQQSHTGLHTSGKGRLPYTADCKMARMSGSDRLPVLPLFRKSGIQVDESWWTQLATGHSIMTTKLRKRTRDHACESHVVFFCQRPRSTERPSDFNQWIFLTSRFSAQTTNRHPKKLFCPLQPLSYRNRSDNPSGRTRTL